jgi:hypothetical protein
MKGSAICGMALREPAVVGHRRQQRLEEKKVAPVLRAQRWKHARAFSCGDGDGASRLRCQSRRELGCCTRL